MIHPFYGHIKGVRGNSGSKETASGLRCSHKALRRIFSEEPLFEKTELFVPITDLR